MYALIDYKGQQIILEEGKIIKFPYLKDLKPGSTIELDKVLYFFDGKKKKIGNPFIKSFCITGIVDSHMKDPKVIVFKKKRRKGYQKKNGHRQPYTLLKIEKLESKKTAKKRVATKKTVKPSSTGKFKKEPKTAIKKLLKNKD